MRNVILMASALILFAPPAFPQDGLGRIADGANTNPIDAAPERRTPVEPTPGPALREPDMVWVESTLAAMSLDEKIGQMIMPQWTSTATATNYISDYDVGGFIFLANNSTTIQTATNDLQAIAPVPLLFSIDCEAGSGARITDGTRFPMNMALSSVNDTELAREQGRITARECRALGVHIGFGPVLDVNNEPINPIIGIRSYGDNTTRIAQLAAAYIEGANSEGLLCTLKHFPGHGATKGDSHQSLQVVDIPNSELESIHVQPYSSLISAGFDDLVMSGHVWYPNLDPGPNALPATLSSNAMTDILRTDLGFSGVAISDAFNMAGLTSVSSTSEAARVGVQAGLDIILMPTSIPDVVTGIRDAVDDGIIAESRIDDSVRRILILKSRVGMPESTTTSTSDAAATLQHADHLAVAEEIGQKAIASALVNPAEFPVNASQDVLVVAMTQSNQIFYSYPSSYFTDAMQAELPSATIMTVSATPSFSERTAVLSAVSSHDRIILAAMDWKPTMNSSKQSLVSSLLATDVPMAYVTFGSPYHIEMFEGLENYYCAFSSHYASQEQMALVLTGTSATGDWPVVLESLQSDVNDWMPLDSE